MISAGAVIDLSGMLADGGDPAELIADALVNELAEFNDGDFTVEVLEDVIDRLQLTVREMTR